MRRLRRHSLSHDSLFRSNSPLGALAVALLFLFASSAWADTEIVEDGRRSASGAKGIQSEVNGVRVEAYEISGEPPGRQRIERGRLLRAVPRDDVAVGVIGCPGCGDILRALGGIYLGFDDRRPARRPKRN